MSIRHPWAVATALTASLALVVAGCGSEEDTGATEPAGQSEPAGPTGDPDQDERPQRIVSLSPSATEILFAIGAGDQVVAADEFSTYPPEAPTTDLSGFDPNVEAIVGYQPDLVVLALDANDLVASLQAVDIPVVVNDAPTTVEDGWDEMAALGVATGRVDESAAAVADLRQQVDAAFAAGPDADQGQGIRVYHELDSTFFAASSNGFVGDIYSRFGAVNIADEADVDGTGFPQLTEEAVIEADPQLIVISDQVGYTAEDVAARPGWADVEAVRTGNIVVVDGDIASRWGPRLPQLIQDVAAALSEVTVPAGR